MLHNFNWGGGSTWFQPLGGQTIFDIFYPQKRTRCFCHLSVRYILATCFAVSSEQFLSGFHTTFVVCLLFPFLVIICFQVTNYTFFCHLRAFSSVVRCCLCCRGCRSGSGYESAGCHPPLSEPVSRKEPGSERPGRGERERARVTGITLRLVAHSVRLTHLLLLAMPGRRCICRASLVHHHMYMFLHIGASAVFQIFWCARTIKRCPYQFSFKILESKKNQTFPLPK